MEQFKYQEKTIQLNWIIKGCYRATLSKKIPEFTISGYKHELMFGDVLIGEFNSVDQAKLAAQEYLDDMLVIIAPMDIANVLKENKQLILDNNVFKQRINDLEDLQMQIDAETIELINTEHDKDCLI